MTKLVWGSTGQRFYEAGADRGVLFVDSLGYAWNGLKAVRENPSGGEPRPFYMDGIKYLNLSAAEEFAAQIEAFNAPAEFAACDGTQQPYAGLFITHQPRKSFGLSYRTLVGNDVDNLEHGYKLHIVYNALAKPQNRDNATLNTSPDPMNLSWDIETTPPPISGFRPTAHIVIDSRNTPPVKLEAIEAILYGTDDTAPRLPTIAELLEIFAADYTPYLEILLDEMGGFGDLAEFGEPDLEGDTEDGIYTIPEDSRLVETEEDGIYTLEE